MILLQVNIPHTLEICDDKLKPCFDETSSQLTIPEITESLSPVAKPLSEPEPGNHMVECLSFVIKEQCLHANDAVDDHKTDEPPIPGCEEGIITFSASHLGKFRASGFYDHEGMPKIGQYVATALCRQKLHETVLRELKSSFIAHALQLFLPTWRGSKRHGGTNSDKVFSFPSVIAFVLKHFC